MIGFIVVIVLIIIIAVLIRPSEITSHWHHYFDQLQFSSQDCYKSIQEGIEKRQIPDAQCSRVTFSEGGVLSARREYLRVSNVTYIFNICAAPYGTGFFVSWWLRESKSLAELGFERVFRASFKKTYYQMDSQTMYQEAVHRAVLETIEAITTEKGVRGLSELERQISMNPKFNFQVKAPQ